MYPAPQKTFLAARSFSSAIIGTPFITDEIHRENFCYQLQSGLRLGIYRGISLFCRYFSQTLLLPSATDTYSRKSHSFFCALSP
jgi:hypothetical protein